MHNVDWHYMFIHLTFQGTLAVRWSWKIIHIFTFRKHTYSHEGNIYQLCLVAPAKCVPENGEYHDCVIITRVKRIYLNTSRECFLNTHLNSPWNTLMFTVVPIYAKVLVNSVLNMLSFISIYLLAIPQLQNYHNLIRNISMVMPSWVMDFRYRSPVTVEVQSKMRIRIRRI